MGQKIENSMRSARAIKLEAALAGLIPGALLNWRAVPGTRLRGFLIEERAATAPLPADRVSMVMDAPPFWSLLWPAGYRLCQLLETVPMAGRSCVDLGCGSGLVAVAAAKAGATYSTAADSDPLALEAASVNAAGNGVDLAATARWNGEPCSTLFLADFLYDRSNLDALRELADSAEEIVVMDSRLQTLPRQEFEFMGRRLARAVPDLDPYREFGSLGFWYAGPRGEVWAEAFRTESDCSAPAR